MAQTSPSGGDIKVNDPVQDIGDRVQNETSSAAFGSNIVVGYNDGSRVGGISALSFSTDGGREWTETHIPAYPGGQTLGDPVVAAGPDGEFYYATLAVNQLGISTVGVTRSDDGGATWSPLVDASLGASGLGSFQDKEWLAVDTTDSPYRGNVYVSWTRFGLGDRAILFVRSTDRGETWSDPITLSRSGTFPQGSFIAVGPDGEVHVAWQEGRLIRVSSSTDGGVTFRRPAIAAGLDNFVIPPLNGGFFSVWHFPSMAVDTSDGPHRGTIYIVFNMRGEGRDASDIFLVKSTDGGRRWSRPRRVNDDATEADQWMPSVAVAPDGTVAIMWYDRRNDLESDSLIDVYMTTSTDGGESFAPNRRITSGNWMLVPTPLDLRFGYHGDYNQMAASASHFVLSWGDDREGDPNVFVRVVPITDGAPSPDFTLSSKTLLRNIVAGQSTFFVIGSSAREGFDEPVSLTASPEVPGLFYTFSSESIVPGSDVVLTVETATNIEPGTYLITITGRAGGIEHTTNLRLAVYSGEGLRQPPRLVSESSAGATDPSVAIDPAGTIHVVWEELDRGSNHTIIMYSRRESVTGRFASPIRLSDPALVASDPTIQVDDRGTINVMWTQRQPGSGFQDVFLSRSTDGGESFSEAVNVSQTMSSRVSASAPALAVDGDGNIYASWTQSDLSSGSLLEDVYFRRSTDGGESFSEAVNVSQVPDSNIRAFSSSIAVDDEGNINLLWTQLDFNGFSENIFLSRSTDGGETFSAAVNLTQFENAFIQALGAVLGVDGMGNIYVAWTQLDFDRGGQDVYFSFSQDGGETFTDPVNVSRTDRLGAIVTGIAAMTIQGEGDDPSETRIFLVWTDTSANNYEIFFSRSIDGGQTFSKPVNASGTLGFSFDPDVAVARDGRIAIVWDDDTDGIGQIFLNLSSGS
ncbi:MAG: exo-alpha-sialidase [Acidobacteria bacterium]|nr:MAG: exo-alpha-sialidase [Acidobacteriota bacterium]